jgi:hypothetical protein
MDGDVLVRDYLGRLEAAAWPLAVDRRAELIGEVREHIDAALREAGRSDEVTIRNVLERLGRPEEIVAAESEPGAAPSSWIAGQQGAIATTSSPWGPIEIIAVVLLTVGALFLPFVGPIIGLVFVWASARWTTRDKLIATIIVAVLLLLPILFLLGANTHGSSL